MSIRGPLSLDDQDITPDRANVPARIRTVVAAVDLSGPSTAAVEYAAALAGRANARLYLVHVVNALQRTLPAIAESEDEIGDIFELAERRVDTERQILGLPRAAASFVAVEVVRFGKPARELATFAEEKQADVIVTGTHERAGLARLIAGSTAGAIVERAPCPVLVVREGVRPPAKNGFARALAAIDATDSSRDALHSLVRVAPDATIDAVHVARPGEATDDAAAALERWLAAMPPEDRARTNPLVRTGDPREVLTELATTTAYHLVACGTHGLGRARDLVGSVARTLVERADCPVLVLREGRGV